MNDNFNTESETLNTGAGVRKANPSYYLDRKSATILMIIKLAEGLTKLCIAIMGAVMLQTVITALNGIFQQGSTISDGKAMVAQVLQTLRFPAETIKQVVDAFPLEITFSSKPVVYLFVTCLPFVVIAVLEAIAAIRLRLGKGGTSTIGILQMVYYVLDAIKIIALALTAIILCIITIFRVGGAISIMLSTVYVAMAVFFILISLPTLFYHRNISRIMGDIRYEMETGRRAVRRQTRFSAILSVLIFLEVIGAVASIVASWRPERGGIAAALLIAALIGPAARLLKYICVKCCYRNYMEEDSPEEPEGSISHVPQIILILLVVVFFAIPNILFCTQSKAFSTAVVEKVEEFMSNARQTVDVVSSQADEQIGAVEQMIGIDTGSGETAAVPQATAQEETTVSTPSQGTTAESAALPNAEAPTEAAANTQSGV